MKTLTLLFLTLIAVTSNSVAQNKFTTGDKELDKSILAVTKYSRANTFGFQEAIIGKYLITKEQAQSYTNKFAAGDLLMIFETAVELEKTRDEIAEFYLANRIKKNWQEILKELGVKDKAFEKIKSKVVNNGII